MTHHQKPWPPPSKVAYEHLRHMRQEVAAPSNFPDTNHQDATPFSQALGRLRSLLAVTDLGQDSESVLHAAAKLALRHGIALHLAYHCRKPHHGFAHR